MAGKDNLIPTNKRTKEELRVITRNGGIASGEARRKKKTIKEAIKAMLEADCPEHLKKKLEGAVGADVTSILEAITARQIEKAIKKGDTASFNSLLDRAEGKPVQRNETENKDVAVFTSDEDEQILNEYGKAIQSDTEE